MADSRSLQSFSLQDPSRSIEMSYIIGELHFFDDEKVVFVRLDQSQVVESLHEDGDSSACRSHHARQLVMAYLELDTDAFRVLLAHRPRQPQQRLAEPLFAVDR